MGCLSLCWITGLIRRRHSRERSALAFFVIPGAPTSSSAQQEQQLVNLTASSSGSSANRSPAHSRPASRKSLQPDDGASGSDSDTGSGKGGETWTYDFVC